MRAVAAAAPRPAHCCQQPDVPARRQGLHRHLCEAAIPHANGVGSRLGGIILYLPHWMYECTNDDSATHQPWMLQCVG